MLVCTCHPTNSAGRGYISRAFGVAQTYFVSKLAKQMTRTWNSRIKGPPTLWIANFAVRQAAADIRHHEARPVQCTCIQQPSTGAVASREQARGLRSSVSFFLSHCLKAALKRLEYKTTSEFPTIFLKKGGNREKVVERINAI